MPSAAPPPADGEGGGGAGTVLLTPGPLTTRPETRAAMDRDWGSRDAAFIELTARVRRRLLALAAAGEAFTCVPMQGSGTFAVEAQLGTLVPRDGRLLILVGGAYGRRMVEICRRMARAHSVLETGETVPPTASALAERLAAEPDITDVALVHCETTTGILNPLADLAAAVSEAGRRLHVDAMSSFGGIPIDLGRLPLTSLAASANKCLEGAPGVGFVIVRTGHLAGCARQRPCREPRPARPVDRASKPTASGGSRRRHTSLPRSTGRSMRSMTKAASPAASPATGRTAAPWWTACAASASRRCWPMPCRRRSS